MIIGTDDAACRDLTFVWFGPADKPMPFEARYQAWIGAIALAPVLAFVTFLLLFPMDLLPWHFLITTAVRVLLALLAGATLAVLLVRRFGQVVTPTRPATHHLTVLMGEVLAPRKRKATQHRIARQQPPSRTRTVWVTKRGNREAQPKTTD